MTAYLRFIPIVDDPFPISYATKLSSGIDLCAYLDSPTLYIAPGERKLIDTGYKCIMWLGCEGQIRSRSGLAAKHGIIVLNAPGTIDADYRGEIKVILINLSNEVQTIQHGDRIAQMVFQKVEKINWQSVTDINETERGAGGFGHTGK